MVCLSRSYRFKLLKAVFQKLSQPTLQYFVAYVDKQNLYEWDLYCALSSEKELPSAILKSSLFARCIFHGYISGSGFSL